MVSALASSDTISVCVVCDDEAPSIFSEVRACRSCRLHTVRNELKYTCRHQKNCNIDNPSKRYRCQYCRFQKCLSMGMKPEAIRVRRTKQSTSPAQNTVPVEAILDAELSTEVTDLGQSVRSHSSAADILDTIEKQLWL